MKSVYLSSSSDELKASFYALKTREDVANLLEITDYQLRYHLYIFPHDKIYKKFEIKKKSGGVRVISAPITPIKIIQSKLNQVLQLIYQPRPSIHGFTLERSIVTNAQLHLQQKYVFNLDIQDFFPSINFGRVRGLLLSNPYNCTPEVATVLAQICCSENQLPQGAPSSPIISNMICSKLDAQLQRLASANRCIYSRYADDITFSTSRTKFPIQIAKCVLDDDHNNQIILSRELVDIIKGNGFSINESKVRLQNKYVRQEVTGIIVNKKLNVRRKYIRQIRAMLHAWEKYGLENAEKEFWEKYDKKYRSKRSRIFFKDIIRGKIEFIGHVRGRNDTLYLRMLSWLRKLDPDAISEDKINFLISNSLQISEKLADLETPKFPKPSIWVEGKTDIVHLKSALTYFKRNNFDLYLDLEFKDDLEDHKQGNQELLSTLKHLCKMRHSQPIIAMFDFDVPSVTKQVKDDSIGFKDWGNGVYSCVLPVPRHRSPSQGICIEHYYQDEEITREDKHGRRLFMAGEFHPESRRHLNLDLTNPGKKLDFDKFRIIDDDVFDRDNKNVALSKKAFAEMVSSNPEEFNFSEFKLVFELVKKIQIYHLNSKK